MKEYSWQGHLLKEAWCAGPEHKYIEEPPGPCQFDVRDSFGRLEDHLLKSEYRKIFAQYHSVRSMLHRDHVPKELVRPYFLLGTPSSSIFDKDGLLVMNRLWYRGSEKHVFVIGSALDRRAEASEELIRLYRENSLSICGPEYESWIKSEKKIVVPNRTSRRRIASLIVAEMEAQLLRK